MNTRDIDKYGEGSDMTSSVLSRITKEHVTPTPRSHFIFKEGVVWSVGGLSVLLGGLGVAAIIFTVRYSEWEYFDATHDNFLNFLLDIMPYTWIIALILFAVLAYESVRHTKRGYRYHVPVLILGSVGASVALGSVIYAFGAGPFIDRQIGSFIPLHRNLRDTKLAFWNQPDRGIMAGVITEISSTRDEFKLATPSHEIHSIRMDSLPEKVRGTVVVGEAMRVFAPLVEKTVIDVSDDDASGLYTESMTSTTVSVQNSEANIDTRTLRATAPNTRSMMNMAQQRTAPSHTADTKNISPRKEKRLLLREACLVLPLHIDGDTDNENRRESINTCLKSVHRGERR